jgi:hypothetical protein
VTDIRPSIADIAVSANGIVYAISFPISTILSIKGPVKDEI